MTAASAAHHEASYEAVASWYVAPAGVETADIPGVAVGPDDDVYLFVRSAENPIVVVTSAGDVIGILGRETIVGRPHGIAVGADGSIYAVCDSSHTVTKLDAQGEHVWTLGTPDRPAASWSGEPFCRPTHVAVSSQHEYIYVSDGYRNGRVHKYTTDGEHVLSWGAAGSDAGQFVLPHGVAVDRNEVVYVADREAHRVQVFTEDGAPLAVWSNLLLPTCVAVGPDGNIFVSEFHARTVLASDLPLVGDRVRFGQRVSVFTPGGELVDRIGGPAQGHGASFIAPHALAVDSHGNIYVTEVTRGVYPRISDGREAPSDVPLVTKVARR